MKELAFRLGLIVTVGTFPSVISYFLFNVSVYDNAVSLTGDSFNF